MAENIFPEPHFAALSIRLAATWLGLGRLMVLIRAGDPGAVPLGRRGRTSTRPEDCAALRVEDRVTGRDEV